MVQDESICTRRHVLAGIAAVGATTFLQGCFLAKKPVLQTAQPAMLSVDFLSSPLTIDAHCHIFNGSDLQVTQFISRVFIHESGLRETLVKLVAQLLQQMVWDSAPNGDREMQLLEQLTAAEGFGTDDLQLTPLGTSNGLTFPATLRLLNSHNGEAYTKARIAVLGTQSAVHLAPQTESAAMVRAPETPGLAESIAARNSSPTLAPLLAPEPGDDAVLRQIYASFQPRTLEGHLKLHSANLSTLKDVEIANRAQPAASSGNLRPTRTAQIALGIVQFIIENFQYRIVAVQDYLTNFTKLPKRNVDLMVAHLVDYDWPLNSGSATRTPLHTTHRHATQIDVMAKISLLTRGQVHGFVPFDPIREVAFRAGKLPARQGESWSSLELVKTAIGNIATSANPTPVVGRGFIGVKLYPPMGFAPFGNSKKPFDFWVHHDLPPWVGDLLACDQNKPAQHLGPWLDQVLGELYDWCADQQVPILAHSNESNGPYPEFEELATAPFWSFALQRQPKLKVCFGHLGNFSAFSTPKSPIHLCASDIPCSAEDFILLFAEGSQQRYGDAAFSDSILDGKEMLEDRYNSAFSDSSSLGNKLLGQRMLYGTDWDLLMTQGDSSHYMESFIQLAGQLPPASIPTTDPSPADRFFGWNAVDFLGLQPGTMTRQRLQGFYSANGFDFTRSPPVWMAKVDKYAN